jgi:peroxiredoxin
VDYPQKTSEVDGEARAVSATASSAEGQRTICDKLGITPGMVVQEVGADDDIDVALRDAIVERTGTEIVGADYDDVVDVVLLWWREDDGADVHQQHQRRAALVGHAARVPEGHARAEAVTAEVGTPAPLFEGRDQYGAPLSLTALLASSRVLLVFVPWAFSRICRGELGEFRDRPGELAALGVAVVVVSCDAMFSQRVWSDTESFGFPLVSDHWPHGAIARSYGVFDDIAGVALRGSFLIGRDGVVQWSVVNGIGEARPMSACLAAAAETA